MAESLGARFRVIHGLHDDDPVSTFFTARVIDEGRRELHAEDWATSTRSLADLGEPLMRSTAREGETIVIEREGVLLRVSMHGGYVAVQAAADGEQANMRALAWLHELLPTPEPVARQEVPVVFWTYSAQGPMPSVRTIAVPEWDEIHDNYSSSTRAGLESIMRDFRPAHGGQLVLWHGDVGTGKTFALRALAWEWREWCRLHYVVDPDTFFGEHADYLMTVLMQSGGIGGHVEMLMSMHGAASMGAGFTSYPMIGLAEGPDGDFDEDLPDELDLSEMGSRRAGPHWRLLVLEDTGELLRPDAKTIIGQGLSRFLNVVDGLIGQGLRVLVLVTTNERIETLHPAVARPGRCAANIEFGSLSADETATWLGRHGLATEADAAGNLASLYAQLEGREPDVAKFEA
jgi:hypothetical protein